MGKNADIVVLGNLSMDYVGIAKIITDSNYSTQVKRMDKFFGGRGANFVVFSKIFGMDPFLIGYAGRDYDGRDYMDYLQRRGIETAGIYHTHRSGTTKAFIFKDIKKTRIFFYDAKDPKGTDFRNHALRALRSMKSYKALYCTSQIPQMNMMFLASKKPSADCINVFAPGHNLYHYSKDQIESCLSHTDMLILNEYEYSVMRRHYKKGVIAMARDFGIEHVIVTLGAKGLVLVKDGMKTYVPAYRASRVLDQTGAGDSFAAAFVSNFLKTGDIVRSARIACSTASFVVQEIGCQVNMPTKKAIYGRMKRNTIIKSNVKSILKYVN